jgi:CheY-like chemotaxis protein
MRKDAPILVMEDDANDALLLKRALRKAGISNPIHVAPNGEEGIAYLNGNDPRQHPSERPTPCFIITDLNMPKKSGLEVLEWLCGHPELRVVPTLVLTSSREQRDVSRAYGFGANSYLVKPNDLRDLERMASLIRDYWAACEKPEPRRTGQSVGTSDSPNALHTEDSPALPKS